MNDTEIRLTIHRLQTEEYELRTRHRRGPLEESDANRLRELKEALNQSWDLLRQRRARREFGFDPDEVGVRDPEVIERYRQ